MFSRKELESLLGYKLSDEEWAEARREMHKAFDEAMDRIWDEDHPMDE